MEILIIVGIIFFFFIWWTISTTNKEISRPIEKNSKVRYINPSESYFLNEIPAWVYKNPIIKELPIVGTYYEVGEDKRFSGNFFGYAECDNNPYDYYSVGVFNNKGIQLGYVPKKNVWLFHSLNHYHNGKVSVWGGLSYNASVNRWSGIVHIPVGYPEHKINIFQTIISLAWENEGIYSKSEKTISDYSKLLKNHDKMTELAKSSEAPGSLYFIINKGIFNQYSKLLEKNKDWETLANLEKYSAIFYQINEKTRKKIWERINKANSNIAPSILETEIEDLMDGNKKSMENPGSKQWETPRAYWSNIKLPGYRYSGKKKAWWKQKENL